MIKGVGETVKNEATEEIGEFLSLLLGTIGSVLLGNLIIRKGVKESIIPGRRLMQGTVRSGEGKIRAGQNF